MRTHVTHASEPSAAARAGANIRALRVAQRKTLAQLADEAARQLGEGKRFDLSNLSKIERGAPTMPDRYEALAGALGVSMAALFGAVPAPARSCEGNGKHVTKRTRRSG